MRAHPKKRSAAQLAGAIAVILTAAPPVCSQALAAEPTSAQAPELSGPVRRLQMGVGKSVIVDLPAEANEIFVGDPKVANAIVRSARRLYIDAIANGQTSIFALDKSGRQIVVLEISVGRDVGELSDLLRAAIPGNDIQVKTVADSIILIGSVASAGEAQKALDIAGGFVGNSSGSSSSTAAGPGGSSISITSGNNTISGKGAIGVGTDGYRQILGVAEGEKEDLEGWRGFLRHLKDRGLNGVQLMISDACRGLIEAVAELYPEARWQRCVVHWYRNVFSHSPRGKVAEVARMLKAIHAQEDRMSASAKIAEVVNKLKALKLTRAAELVANHGQETLTYFALSQQSLATDQNQ